jgi:hypothetical protein
MFDFLKLFLGQVLRNKLKGYKNGQSIEYFTFMFCVLVLVMIWHLIFSQQITSATKARCDVIPESPNSKVAGNLK